LIIRNGVSERASFGGFAISHFQTHSDGEDSIGGMGVMDIFVLHNLKLELQEQEGKSIKRETLWMILWWMNIFF